MELLRKYFPDLPAERIGLFKEARHCYEEWNRKINLISRNDMVNFEIRHLLHSLSITRVIRFRPGTRVLDIGTGGGLPGLPLALFFPETEFILVDSIGKKIHAVSEMIRELGILNASTLVSRSEQLKLEADFILGRAVSKLPDFCRMTKHLVVPGHDNPLWNGILYLSGGLESSHRFSPDWEIKEWNIGQWFGEPFFGTKKILYVRPYKAGPATD